jgi:hypothetical protein
MAFIIAATAAPTRPPNIEYEVGDKLVLTRRLTSGTAADVNKAASANQVAISSKDPTLDFQGATNTGLVFDT